MLTMSYSAYNAFYSCPRKYYLSYILRWEPLAVPSYFAEGRLFHTAAGLYATGVPIAEVVKAIRKEAEKARSTALAIAEHSDITVREGKIAGMISAFAAVRGKAPYGASKDILLEQWVRDNGNPNVPIVGKLDLINRSRGLIVDFKSTGQLDEDEIEAERVSMQYYLYGALYETAPGRKLKHILVELAAKPNLRLKAGETLEQFTNRIAEVCRNNADSMIARVEIPWDKKAKELGEYYFRQLVRLGTTLAEQAQLVSAANDPVLAFPPVTDSCYLFSPCGFFPICSKNMLKIPAKPPMGFRPRQKSE